MRPDVHAFFHEPTNTVTYLVADLATKKAALIDPVLDFEPASGKVWRASVDNVLAEAKRLGLTISWILETHAHADHLSGAQPARAATGAPIVIGDHIRDVQHIFAPKFLAEDITDDYEAFDKLVHEGDTLPLGELTISVLHTPGHTPACVTYVIGDAAFVGDTLFMPDYGTARADFPGGDAASLYRSIRKILALPTDTRIFVGHDYKAPGRDAYAWETSVAAERAKNVQVNDTIDEDAFVAARKARDATLAAPRLLLPSLQVNIRGGRLPPADKDGVVRFRIPITDAS
ncbi:MAG: MBL fold metallo-hydrolase [Hyphomonadaceae bacterium]|nr:MBL fold metallo-hydrolase [Hyphomonadaceae bacterium]MCA8886557.1 MBL fold metallo-hydrolase [Hyphomonadaceae bacterium]